MYASGQVTEREGKVKFIFKDRYVRKNAFQMT